MPRHDGPTLVVVTPGGQLEHPIRPPATADEVLARLSPHLPPGSTWRVEHPEHEPEEDPMTTDEPVP